MALMAESQIAGLFMTPEMYQRQQMQADRQRAAEYAQLAPEQRAAMGFFSAGQGLGRAAGTLLGAQDPQLQRITEQQQMLQGLDVADPDSLMEAARRASQAGNVPLAMQLAQQANQANQARDAAEQRRYQLAQLQEQERQRRLTAAAQGVAQGAVQMSPATIQGLPVSENMPLRDDEGNMMPGASPEALTLNIDAVAPLLATMGPAGAAALKGLVDARDAMLPKTQVVPRDARLVDPRTGRELVPAAPKEAPRTNFGADAERFARELYNKGYGELTQTEVAEVNKRIEEKRVSAARASAPTVVMPAQARAENAYAAQVGKEIADRDIKTIDAASAVAQTLPKMYETRQLIETGNLNTGILAEVQQTIDRARKKFGDDKKAGKRVTDTEYLNALLGSDVFPQISELGIGARGLDTPAEREFLRQVITGTIQMDRETLKRMINFRINAAEKAVDGYNTRLNAGEFEQFKRTTGRALAPIAVNRPPAANDPLGVRPK
jgi:hypothetical protein